MSGNVFTVCALLAITPVGCLAALDGDGDGLCDVWEAKYHAGGLVSGEDSDGDGADNAAEAIAGTDPFDPLSRHRAAVGTMSAANGEIVVPSEKGKQYRLLTASDIGGSWQPYGAPQTATGGEVVFDGPRSGDRLFYRVAVTDADSDGDGVTDWEERQLAGFDTENDDSFASGSPNNDFSAASEIMQALLNGEVTSTVVAPDAFEKEGIPASVTLSRSGSTTYPITVFFRHRGSGDPVKSSASPADFSFGDGSGGTPAGFVVIPAGSSTATLLVKPVAESSIEVPEQLFLDFSFAGTGLLTRICDGSNIPANERLFYAAYRPEAGSTASGYTFIRLQGDNDVGLVSSSFSGLTTAQTEADIEVKNPITGPQIKSLPRGQIVDYAWSIRASQFFATDQAVLDALFLGKLYASVHTEQFPGGEIRGDFLLTSGSIEFTPPAEPPAIDALTGADLDRDIARFLTQSTFGPTPQLIDELRTLVNSPPHNGDRISAFSAWLDVQLDSAQTPIASLQAYCEAEDDQLTDIYTGDPSATYYNADYQPSQSSRRRGWWTIALFANDQVRQRLGTALSEILVTSAGDSVVDTRHYGHSNYYDMLVAGIDGTYRELLEGVSVHPIMGQYLSSLRNQKEITDGMGNVLVSPDENFAREIMQLFSIGLVQLHPDGSLKLSASGQPVPTYGQADIIDLARLFTGWSFSKRNSPSNSDTVVDNTNFNQGNGNQYYQAQWIHPMKQFPVYHDTEAKAVLGLNLPAGQTGEVELDAFLDHLAAHPNIAPFISKRLIQRLVSSNPSAGYVHRVATAWQSSGGNLKQVAKAVLLDYEARSLDAPTLVGAGKKKEPLLHYTGLARAIQATTELQVSDLAPFSSPSLLDAFPAGAGRFMEGDTTSSLGQTPLDAPSVFNWFYPDYSTGDAIADAGLVTPEFQIATEINTINHINRHYTLTTSSTGESATALPNYAVTGYTANADHLIPDITLGSGATQAREQVYMAVMDENGDGVISSTGDPGTFNNPAKIREACAALVDHLDLLLCGGTLKADYGASADTNNPRDILIDFLVANSASLDDNNNATDQLNVRHERYEKAAYLISVSPQSMIQR